MGRSQNADLCPHGSHTASDESLRKENMESPIQALQRQRALLEIEYNCEKEAFRKQTETMGLQRKVKRGDAWFPLKVGRSYYNSLNQLAIEITRQTDTEIEHNFEFGRDRKSTRLNSSHQIIAYAVFC